MEFDSDKVQLTEYEQIATGLPDEFPVEMALVHAQDLKDRRIPELRDAVLEAQSDDSCVSQFDTLQMFHQHFRASIVAGGLLRAADARFGRLYTD